MKEIGLAVQSFNVLQPETLTDCYLLKNNSASWSRLCASNVYSAKVLLEQKLFTSAT